MYKKYIQQSETWPKRGKHILAKYDTEIISVYQAYNKSIAKFAVENQRFGGGFSYSRMSWIKPGFLWMMFRSRWASKDSQESILEIKIRKSFFDQILENAIPSSFDKEHFETKEEWKIKLEKSEVRLQWDSDHDPYGNHIERRAVQLGLRNSFLERYGKDEIIQINDITGFVKEQKSNLDISIELLLIPDENVYISDNNNAMKNIGIIF